MDGKKVSDGWGGAVMAREKGSVGRGEAAMGSNHSGVRRGETAMGEEKNDDGRQYMGFELDFRMRGKIRFDVIRELDKKVQAQLRTLK
jgi:hypothetical protein